MMSGKERLEAYLQENNVSYQVQEHAVAYTAQEIAESEHIPGKILAKVVMAIAGGELIMLVLPAPNRIDLAKAGLALGTAEVRLAEEEEFATVFHDSDIGAMHPFG